MKKNNGNGDKKKKESTTGTAPGSVGTTASSPPKGVATKGTQKFSTYKGKRMVWTANGKGGWSGRVAEKPDMKKVKPQAKTNYKSTRSKKGKMKKGV